MISVSRSILLVPQVVPLIEIDANRPFYRMNILSLYYGESRGLKSVSDDVDVVVVTLFFKVLELIRSLAGVVRSLLPFLFCRGAFRAFSCC